LLRGCFGKTQGSHSRRFSPLRLGSVPVRRYSVVVNAVLLRQLPYDAPDRLVTLFERDVSSPGLDEISFASARAYRERSRTLESLLQYNDSGGGRLILNDGEELRGQSVSPEFFRTLGIRAELGRVFEAGPFGRFWTQGQFRGFILLHELGHQLSDVTDFQADTGSRLNQIQSQRVLAACF
jgi:hypothetical protein